MFESQLNPFVELVLALSECLYSPPISHILFLHASLLLPQILSSHFHLVYPAALPDYEGVNTSNPNAVVLGDATTSFTYDNLNHAFRILTNQPGSTLISLGQG